MYSTRVQMQTLQDVLDSQLLKDVFARENLPPALLPAHLTDVVEFEEMSVSFFLPLKQCTRFGEPLVYLFYGGAFYRGSFHPASQTELPKWPVALYFFSQVLNQVDRFYPCDTGALLLSKYEDWKERFLIKGPDNAAGPRQLVRIFFGTNHNYMKGLLNPEMIELPEPASLLAEFLAEDFTPAGVDQRHYRIEAQCKQPVSLQDLFWVGYPDEWAVSYGRLFDRLGLPDNARYVYDTFKAGRPAEMAAILQAKGLEFMRSQFPELAL